MTAQIVMDDGTPVTGSIETTASTPIDLSNFDNSGVLGWEWSLFDKPAGSAATLSSANASTSQLTPDLPGTYVIRLVTYADAERTEIDDADEQCAAVRYSTGFEWRIPGAGETLQFDPTVGWKPELNQILEDIHDYMLMPTDDVIATSYNATYGELVVVDLVTAADNVTVNLPTAIGKAGKRVGVKMKGVAGLYGITINGLNTEEIDGNLNVALTTDGSAMVLVSNGTGWIIESNSLGY